jgi:3-phenylpropionate/trans-cinnamate dioxygenase ferredoxin reductase subunit
LPHSYEILSDRHPGRGRGCRIRGKGVRRTNRQERGLAIITVENELPYERPPLSKGFLAGKEGIGDIQISDAAFYREQGIAVLRNCSVGKVDFRRRRLQSISRKVIGFDQLLIATGSSVRRLKMPGASRSQIFYLRQIEDSQAIREQIKRGRRAVVIGAGFIGMEVASVLASHGVRTTMVFPDDPVWKRLFTPPISTFFERQFAGRGITFIKNEKVTALTHTNRGCQVVLDSGKQVSTDFVVAGIGVTPSMELFHGTPLDIDGSIKVNNFLETNVTGVWAAGDIANYPDQIIPPPHAGGALGQCRRARTGCDAQYDGKAPAVYPRSLFLLGCF